MPWAAEAKAGESSWAGVVERVSDGVSKVLDDRAKRAASTRDNDWARGG